MIVGSSSSQGSAGDYTWRYRLWKRLYASGEPVDFVGPNSRLYDNVRSQAGSFVESDAYADPGFDRDHNARWGRFLGTFTGQVTGAKDTIRGEVTMYQSQYVIVMLGLNDLVSYPSRTPALITQDMSAFIYNARVARPDLRFVLVAVQPTKGAIDDATLGARVTEYNRLLGELANTASTATSPVAYVPQAANYQPDYLQTRHDAYDGTHPNAHGEIKIADAIGNTLAISFGLGSVHPGVPVGPRLGFALRCVSGNGSATLTWDESPGATGYWMQRRVVGEEWQPSVYQLKISDQPFVNSWLYNGVTYEYRLQAAKWYDKGVYSNVCTVTPHA